MNESRVTHSVIPRGKRLGRCLYEFNRRRVGRATTTYAVAMWLSLQVADIVVPMLGLPPWTLSLIVTLGLLGFPVVITLAWIFQITEDGIVVDAPSGDSGESRKHRQLALDASLLALALLLTILTSLQLGNWWS